MRAIPEGPKFIGLNTAHGSLEHPNLEGNVFNIKDVAGKQVGSAKKYITLTQPSVLRYAVREGAAPFPVVFIETRSEVLCYDEGVPGKCATAVHVLKQSIVDNARSYLGKGDGKYTSVTAIERDGTVEYGHDVALNGPCHVVYDPDNYHPLGGKVRIETDAPTQFIEVNQ